jgi:hypothetical protein
MPGPDVRRRNAVAISDSRLMLTAMKRVKCPRHAGAANSAAQAGQYRPES